MKIRYEQKANRVIFSITTEDDDLLGQHVSHDQRKFKLGDKSCFFEVPPDWRLSDTHPDIMALVAFLVVEPFIGSRLKLSHAVSPGFAREFSNISGKTISPVDDNIEHRRVDGGVPGLAYSGGVDSTAALLLMPKTTQAIFLDRVIKKEKKGLYNKSAALHACGGLKEKGWSVHMIKTDIESVRDPIGFPHTMSAAAPAVLMADYLNLNSIGYGNIMEAVYDIGFGGYESSINKFTELLPIFAAAGLPAGHITGGISEVATMKLVSKSELSGLVSSCIRGSVGEPCNNCIKCFRKTLLGLASSSFSPEDEFMDDLFLNQEAPALLSRPAPLENIYTYVTSRYKGAHRLTTLLKKKTRGDIIYLNWLDRWYPESRALLPKPIRGEVEGTIAKTIGRMSRFQCAMLRIWRPDLVSALSPLYRIRHRRFYNAFIKEISMRNNLFINYKRIKLKPGQTLDIEVFYLKDKERVKVTKRTSFKSTRDHVSIVEGGRVYGLRPGSTLVTASWHGRRAVVGIEVLGNSIARRILDAEEHAF